MCGKTADRFLWGKGSQQCNAKSCDTLEPKGESNREHKASLNIEGVPLYPTRKATIGRVRWAVMTSTRITLNCTWSVAESLPYHRVVYPRPCKRDFKRPLPTFAIIIIKGIIPKLKPIIYPSVWGAPKPNVKSLSKPAYVQQE